MQRVIVKNVGPASIVLSDVDEKGNAKGIGERAPDGDHPGIEVEIEDGHSLDIAIGVQAEG